MISIKDPADVAGFSFSGLNAGEVPDQHQSRIGASG
jgi:hypothetical protein